MQARSRQLSLKTDGSFSNFFTSQILVPFLLPLEARVYYGYVDS